MLIGKAGTTSPFRRFRTRLRSMQRERKRGAGTAEAAQWAERLEALLTDFECRNENVPHPALRVDVAAIRKKLGL